MLSRWLIVWTRAVLSDRLNRAFHTGTERSGFGQASITLRPQDQLLWNCIRKTPIDRR
jgi:hypothetical protein